MDLEKEKEELLTIAADKGYKYFYKNKYYWADTSTTSEKKVLKWLGLPEILNDPATINLYGRSKKDDCAEILQVLRALKGAPEAVTGSEEIISAENAERAATKLRESTILFKTVLMDSFKDPGASRSGGYSVIAMNKNTRELVNPAVVSIDAILTTMGVPREEVPMRDDIPLVYPKFNPFTTDITFEAKHTHLGGDTPELCLNTAMPPLWMKLDHAGLVPHIPEFIDRLLNHLFINKEELDRVLDWAHYAIFKRNGTVLCLAGDRGTGKSLFREIMGHLVGRNYSEIVNESVLTDKFNGQFHNKRLVAFEEVALNTTASIAKIKAWCNNKITIESKGMDSFTADNWSSMIFLMNDIADLHVNAQERRFSIPEVAERPLLDVMTPEEISKFAEGLESETPEVMKQIAEFGLFLKKRKPKLGDQVPIKGKHFFKVADTTMAEWQYQLREYIIQHGEVGKIIHLSDVFPDTKNVVVPRKRSTIEAFLSDFRHMGLYKIAQAVDLPADMVAKSNSTGVGMPTSKRTKRTFGILPKEDFIKSFGLKYKMKAEDIL